MAYLIRFLLIFIYAAIVSLLSLLPPLERRARSSRRGRITVVLLIGVLAFVAPFLLITVANARDSYNYASASDSGIDPQTLAQIRGPLIRELLLREALPYSWRPPCFSNQQVICDTADFSGQTREGDYWLNIAFFFVSAVASAGLAWYYTRPKEETEAEENE